MTQEEAKEKYLEYLEGHIGNVREAFELLCTLDIPFINENKSTLSTIISEHDASKYEEPEWTAYLHHFYPTCDEDSLKTEEFEEACRHHIDVNPHHWNYWVSEGELAPGIEEQEYHLYNIERICDYCAMSYQTGQNYINWWNANKDVIIMPEKFKQEIQEILEKVNDINPKFSFKGTREDYKECFCVYEHIFPNGKRYIGMSKNYSGRWRKDGKGYRGNKEMFEAIKEFGWNNIKHNIILENLDFETACIDELRNVYKEEKTLNEMKLSQIKQKSKNEDPERVNRSRKVKTTYLGMSKFGILNFKTTSQSRNGHHYQTVEFRDMKPFEDIIKSGKEIMPMDIKKQIQEQDVNVFCTDESFSYWAWAHSAYKNDFLYIDDRIPDLKKRIQAPKVNNVRLNGGACKHILSVVDYITKPFVLLAISEDMNKFLSGNKEDKMNKQSVATQNQYDGVADWDWSDIEEYTGLSRIQIMSDISKTLQIVPSVDKGDIITDIVSEALPQEDQGLKRDLIDKIEELIEKGDKNE